MSLWRQLSRGMRVLIRRPDSDRDTDDEVRHFIDQATADAVASGVSPAEARRQARLRFGATTAIREEVRSGGWEEFVATVIADVRYAVRGMARRPAFALVAILTLALGIGASTAIFSAVYPIVFAPLPYPNGARVVMLSDQGVNGGPVPVTYGTFHEIAVRSRSFSALAVADRWQPALAGTGDPERLAGDRVSADYFRVLAIAPALGRDFTATDDQPGAPPVAIVSDALARRRFGGAQAVVGRAMVLDGDQYLIIGVMPRTFDNVLSERVEVWVPRRYRSNAPFQSAEWGHHLRMVGRLAPGISPIQAQVEITGIGRAPVPSLARPPWAAMRNGLTIESLQAAVTHDVRPALVAILAAVFLVLAIASVNVANLLLARGAQRRGELAMRATLGASRGRLVRQLLTEGLLLAIVGGILGIGVAAVGVHALVALAPVGLPRAGAISLDAAALVFALVVTTCVGLAVGLAPAWQGSRGDLHSDIRSGARAVGISRVGLRRALVIAEIALAMMVLVGAGLMIRSLARLFANAPGFDSPHLLTLQVEAAGHRYDADTARYQFFTQALDAVRSVPGVQDAAFSSQLPLSGDVDSYGTSFESIPRTDPNGGASALRYAVTPDWFHTMGIPLRRGRLLNPYDRRGTTEAVLISESFARSTFGTGDPIGQRMRAGPEIGDTSRPPALIVGVVGDVKQLSLAPGQEAAFYVSMGQWPWVDNVQSLAVRASGDPQRMVASVERAIWSVDRNQPIIRVATMDELVARSEAQRHFVLTVFAAFGVAALALAAIGVFGLVSGVVTERLAELGVRAALGASRGDILTLILRQGMALSAAGITIGLAGAGVVSGLLRTLLYDISRTDVITYLSAALLVLGIATIASAFPAWRAARVDPTTTLRG